MIQTTTSKLHWNYFLALDHDLELVSRYVEFCEPHFDVYSIEFAHILFAAASEVDVIAELLCKQLNPKARCRDINDYRAVLRAALPALPATHVLVPRYGLTLTPWDNWKRPSNPDWWHSYNKVKHQRDVHFNKATLQNALNALGGLLIFTFYHYSYSLSKTPGSPLRSVLTTAELQPESTLLRLPDDYYCKHLVVTT